MFLSLFKRDQTSVATVSVIKKIFVVVIILIFVIAFHFFARNIDFLFMIVALLLFYMNQVKIITKVVDRKKHVKYTITQVVCICLKFWQGGIQFSLDSLSTVRPAISDRGIAFGL